MYKEILYEVDDPVATITLNRPEKLNAITDRTMQELRHALADAERSEAVVGIALTYYVFRLIEQRDRALAELERCLEEHRDRPRRA